MRILCSRRKWERFSDPGSSNQRLSDERRPDCDSLRAWGRTRGMEIRKIRDILGEQATLLDHQCKTIPASQLTLPSPTYVDEIFSQSDRTPRVLGALQRMFSTGRLANTGYLSILPVDQGIEHSGGASFAP